jgi:O-antigen ligase
VLYAVGMYFIPELMIGAPNSGIRLVFIRDAFQSAYDTYGLGIGYGTESVRWRYHFPGRPDVTFLPDVSTMTPDQLLEVLSTGVHNSFIQALLRTGVIGFIVMIAAFAAVFPQGHLPRKLRNHASVLFIIMFIACFVNPALESPIQGIGVGFLYGYLVALRVAFPPHAQT